jgi:hypothetical protein
LLREWKKICVAAERAPNATTNLLQSSEEVDKLKEHLFIKTGEDTLDTFHAFSFYKLDTKITAKDREKF